MQHNEQSLEGQIALIKLRLINIPDAQFDERRELRLKLSELTNQLNNQPAIKEQIIEI